MNKLYLYDILEKANKDLTTEQFLVYIHNILENGKDVLSEIEKKSLIDGSVKLYKIPAKEEIPNMPKDTYDFLQEHKEIQKEAYSTKQLEEMAEMDKKFKQLGKYSIEEDHTSITIDFENVILKMDKNDLIIYAPFYPAKSIYDTYIGTLTQLKNADIIIKPCKDNPMKMQQFKWDGENFKEISKPNAPKEEDKSTNIIIKVEGPYSKIIQEKVKKLITNHWPEIFTDEKINMNKIEEYVSKEIKEMCEKSWNKSLEKCAISSKDTAEETKKAIDQRFKELGMQLGISDIPEPSKTLRDIFIDNLLKEKLENFREALMKIIDNKLDNLGKSATHRCSPIRVGCKDMEEVKNKIENYIELRDTLKENYDLLGTSEEKFILLANKAFDFKSENTLDLLFNLDIKF